MAEFNPDVGAGPNTNWLGYSQGQSANKTIGKLFEGFSEAADAGLKAYDSAKRTEISLAANKEVNNNLSVAPSQPVPIPEGLKDGLSKLDGYKNALDQGVMSDVEFKVRMDKTAKELRNKYGQGWTDVIDNSLANAQGVSTANQLRTELLSTIKEATAAQDDFAKRKMSFLEKESEYIGNPNVQAAYRKTTGQDFRFGADYNYYALLSAVSAQKALEHQTAVRNAELNLYENADKVNNIQNKKTIAGVASDFVRSTFNEAANKPWADWKKSVSNALDPNGPGGAKLAPEEETQIRMLWNVFKTQAMAKTEEMLSSPEVSNALPDSKDRADIRALVENQIGVYQNMMEDKNYGIFNAIVNENASIESMSTNGVITDPKYGSMMSSIQSMIKIGLPMNVVNQYIDTFNANGLTGPELMKKQMEQHLFGKMIAGGVPDSELIDKYVGEGATKDQIMNALTARVRFALDPAISKEQAVEVMKGLFEDPYGDQYLKTYAKKDPAGMFAMIASPQMTEKMYGTEMWDTYKEWAYNQFIAIGQLAADTIVTSKRGSDSLKITFDGKQFQIEGLTDQSLGKRSALSAGIEHAQAIFAQRAITQMNSYLQQIEPITKHDKITPDYFLQIFMNGQNINGIENEGNFYTKFVNALDEYITSTVESGSAAANSERITGGKNPKTQ